MQVIYEDNHIIVVSKRSGEIVQGDKTGDEPLSETVKAYLKEKYQKPGNVFLGVVHRLDRPVSGLVVFARTSKALARLNKMFATGEVHKTYWAICLATDEHGLARNSSDFATDSHGIYDFATDEHGNTRNDNNKVRVNPCSSVANTHELVRVNPCSSVAKSDNPCSSVAEHNPVLLTHWLTRNEQQNKSYAHDHEVPHSKKAQLRYRVLTRGERYQLLEVELLTGRHHQIRCQLAAAGMPIRGDLKYGAKRSNPDGSISLLSRHIQFIHPVSGQEISLDAPLPDDSLWSALTNRLLEKNRPSDK